MLDLLPQLHRERALDEAAHDRPGGDERVQPGRGDARKEQRQKASAHPDEAHHDRLPGAPPGRTANSHHESLKSRNVPSPTTPIVSTHSPPAPVTSRNRSGR